MTPSTFARVLPTAALAAAFWALAWLESGSIDAADWLPYAALAALLLAIVVASGSAFVPGRWAIVGLGLLVALAAWKAISLTWSPRPARARDEALLTLFYAIALAVPMVTLRRRTHRRIATAIVVAATGSLAVVTALYLWDASGTRELFENGRLSFPITYPNAQAAIFLVGFWPAILLAARRATSPAVRAFALAAAVALLGGWLVTQSKGAGIALAVSAIVLFAAGPARLRILVPTVLTAALVGTVAAPLTEPFRARNEPGFEAAIRDAGSTLFWVTAAALVVGLVYALVDRRLHLGERTLRTAGVLVALLAAGALAAGAIAFFVSVESPGDWVDEKWAAFKQLPDEERTSTHLFSLGSNRYDFWRVALRESKDHALAGIGSRGFEAAYLANRRSGESPARAHSLELDTLSEEGVVGLALLGGALGALVALAAARSRRRALAPAAALGAATYWIVHASGDWIWTFPAVGLPFFLLLGIACSSDGERPLTGRVGLPAAGVAVAAALFAFAPPWLSSRFTDQALRGASTPREELRWARRLDPLSVEPLVAESVLARSPAAAVRPLERAAEKEPRSSAVRYLLGTAYLRAGRRVAGRAELETARALNPRDPDVAAALRRLRRRS